LNQRNQINLGREQIPAPHRHLQFPRRDIQHRSRLGSDPRSGPLLPSDRRREANLRKPGQITTTTRLLGPIPSLLHLQERRIFSLLPALTVGSNGVISALANLLPKVHVQVMGLHQSGEVQKAQEIQRKLSLADWALLKLGISGVKAATTRWFGYGNARPRRPLPEVGMDAIRGEGLGALEDVVCLAMEL
ncbi:hypothetical protein BO78DRAFT_438541, partial [Aspergillus sclerotiicarbonarius CBS 121057]